MKFMKLGSKPDSFYTQSNNIRYVAAELATDVIVSVGDIKFYLHKFPLLSKSARMHTLVLSACNADGDEIDISDIPGGPGAFEVCVKFCYGIIVTFNAYNVVAACCAAEYLEMNEKVEKGNLICKIDMFLNSSIFRSWKDSIIALNSITSLLPWSSELKLISQCVDSIASKCCVDVTKVNWSFTYSREKPYEEHGNDTLLVPKDWWIEDLCGLEVDLFKRVLSNIKFRGRVSSGVIVKALIMYTLRKLPGFDKGMIQSGDELKAQSIIDAVVWLLPTDKGCVSCGFLLELLKAAISVGSAEFAKKGLLKRIGKELEEATTSDLLIRAQEGEIMMYNVEIVRNMVEEFMRRDDQKTTDDIQLAEGQTRQVILDESPKLKVTKLVDEYLTEIAKDPNLPLSMFIEIAETVYGFSRPGHDALYRAIDMYLKAHPRISKSERKSICKLMDCKKLSADACMHAVQNERLPLRVIVQVLFFEQIRATNGSSCSTTPRLPKGFKDSTSNSHGSSRTATTNTDEDLDGMVTTEELNALKAEVAALRLRKERSSGVDAKRSDADKGSISKMKGFLSSRKVFSKLWSNKGDLPSDNTGSDSYPEKTKSTYLRRRHSVS